MRWSAEFIVRSYLSCQHHVRNSPEAEALQQSTVWKQQGTIHVCSTTAGCFDLFTSELSSF